MPSIDLPREGDVARHRAPALESLAFRLARASVLVALLVGSLLSGIQVYLDYGEQSDALERQIDEMLRVAEKPAARAVFTIDFKLADQVAESLLLYDFVSEVKIIGDHGEDLGRAKKNEGEEAGTITRRLFGRTITHTRTLLPPEDEANVVGTGSLIVTISYATALEGFVGRATNVFLIGLARNVLLTLILLYVFRVIATKPLRSFVSAFGSIDPANPDSSLINAPSGHEKTELGMIAKTGKRVMEQVAAHIFERRLAEKKLQEQIEATDLALHDAQKASEAKTRFLAHMSHELRTPLNAIVGYSELISLESERLGPDKIREFVHPIHEAGRMLRSHIDDILSFAQMEHDSLKVELQALPVRVCVASALRLLRSEIKGKDIALKITGRKNAVAVLGDKRLLTQVFINVIGNAVKYSPNSGTIEIAIESDERTCTVRVRDQGPGINDADLDDVIKPFVRSTDPMIASQPGTGLGLSICVEILERMSGELTLRNVPNEGLEVSVTLSRTIPEA